MILSKLFKKLNSKIIKFAFLLISIFTKLLYFTLRVRTDSKTITTFNNSNSSSVFCWHGSLSMLPYVNTYFRKKKPMVGLMSSSRDGDYIVNFFSHFGVKAERGSSSKNGARSAVNLIRILRSGGNICITPDGPRGPVKKVKAGMISVCEKAPDSRLIFVRIKFDKAWEFKSWDNFKIPKPFSKIFIETTEYKNIECFKSEALKNNFDYLEFSERLLG